MKIFIAGATGVLGRRVVQGLLASGHQVIGLSRSKRNHDWLSEQGATPRHADLFDREKLIQASADCEASLHLATSIPAKTRTTAADWALNDRIRREGSQNLTAAALINHHEFYLQQSLAFIYGDRGGEWVDESAPLPEKQVDILQSAVDMEVIVHQAEDEGLPATILRMGRFYSYDSGFTRSQFKAVQNGQFPIVGKGDYYWHLIHVDDAASAVLAALENRQLCLHHTFNICDDEPVRFADLLDFLAGRLGGRSPRRIPVWLAKLMLGGSVVESLMASVRCRTGRFKEISGWQPAYPTYRDGMIAEIERWQAEISQSA